jgi:VWFA-related protein
VDATLPLFVLLLDDLQISPHYTAAAQRAGFGLLGALPEDARLAVVTTSADESALVTFDTPGAGQREAIARFRGQALPGTSLSGGSGAGAGSIGPISIGPMRSDDCGLYCVDPNRGARRMAVLEQLGRILGRAGSRRKVLFWVTESLGYTPVDLEVGREAQRRALRTLLNADVTVYTANPRELRVDATGWSSRDELEAAVPLREFARATGGRHFDNLNKIEVALARSARENLAAYLLAYRPTAAPVAGRRTVEIRLPRHPTLRVQARRAYMPIADVQPTSTSISEGDPNATLRSLLDSPTSGGHLPVRLQIVPVPAPGDEGFVLVSVEGHGQAGANVAIDIALMTIDAKGKASDVASARLYDREPWRVSRLLALSPGIHQVRVVARSADRSQTGVVVTEVNVPSWNASQVWISDPMVVDLSTGPGRSASALSLAARIPASTRAALQFEIAGTHLDALEVAMTVRGDDGHPWQARAELLPGMTAHSRRASLSLPTGLLARGHARVRVEARARGAKTAVRNFTIAVE